MEKEFVTYDIALKLKELGFDEECLGAYMGHKLVIVGDNLIQTNVTAYEANNYIKAPLWQQVWSFLDDNGVIIGIIFVDNVFKYTLNIENYVSDGFRDRMSAIKSATEYATSYLWNKKFNK